MEGRTVPDVVFKTRVRDDSVPGPNPYRWQDVHSDELFKGKRVVVFSLPGAFTPTCSNRPCPAYDLIYDDWRGGVNEVYCISVNDAFVMHQWARRPRYQEHPADPGRQRPVHPSHGHAGNKEHLGFGYRSWRYAMVVNDGVIEKWFEEPGINDVGADDDPYGETDPERVLAYLTAAGGQSPASRLLIGCGDFGYEETSGELSTLVGDKSAWEAAAPGEGASAAGALIRRLPKSAGRRGRFPRRQVLPGETLLQLRVAPRVGFDGEVGKRALCRYRAGNPIAFHFCMTTVPCPLTAWAATGMKSIARSEAMGSSCVHAAIGRRAPVFGCAVARG